MKKRDIWLAAFFLTLLVFALSSCGNGSTDDGKTKFEGKWVNHDAIDNYGMTDVSYVFSGNTFVFTSIGPLDTGTRRGTFIFTDDAFTFTPAAGEWWSAYSQLYSLQGNVLSLHQMNGFYLVSGPFTKE